MSLIGCRLGLVQVAEVRLSGMLVVVKFEPELLLRRLLTEAVLLSDFLGLKLLLFLMWLYSELLLKKTQ